MSPYANGMLHRNTWRIFSYLVITYFIYKLLDFTLVNILIKSCWRISLFLLAVLHFSLVQRCKSWWWHRRRDRWTRWRRLRGLSYNVRHHVLLLRDRYSVGYHSGWVHLILRLAAKRERKREILYRDQSSGLIIDAFGELRDQLDSVKTNMESNCFICGLGKEYFDAVPHGFDTHVQQEHNLANYM